MSREHSAIIKGISILFMMLCHLSFVAGNEVLNSRFFTMLTNASHMINYCLIISGYGLYLVYHKNRLTASYLFKRTLRLYISLWLVLLIFVVGIASWLYPGQFSYSWYTVITNFTAWRWDYCNFIWFLLPYILMTLVSGPVFKLMDRVGNVVSFITGAVLYLVSSWLISRYFAWFNNHDFRYVVYHVVLMSQTLFGLIIGAIFARLTLAGKSLRIAKLEGKSWLVLLIFLVCYIVRGQIQSAALNPFFAILVVLSVINIDWPRPVAKFFSSLGDQLMMMWFAQGFLGAMMFNEFYQPLKNPALMWLVWVIVTYIVACVLTVISNRLAKALKLSR